jgi:hypothetical protein
MSWQKIRMDWRSLMIEYYGIIKIQNASTGEKQG